MEMYRNKDLEKQYADAYDGFVQQFPVKVTELYLESKWCRTHVMHCGNQEGKPLVLLHCMGATSLCWSANIEALAVNYDVYLIDLVGEPNRTVNYTNQITFDNYMEWLNETILSLGLDKTYLAGWSFGGFLAIGYAIHHPERVEKVMALSPAGTVSKLTMKFMMKLFPALISGKETRIHAFWTWICGDSAKIPEYQIFCKGMQSFQGWARGTDIKVYEDSEFAAMQMPCLILMGDRDPIYTSCVQKDVDRINKLNSAVSIEFVKGTHGFLLQNATDTNQRIIDFFR